MRIVEQSPGTNEEIYSSERGGGGGRRSSDGGGGGGGRGSRPMATAGGISTFFCSINVRFGFVDGILMLTFLIYNSFISFL